jgi:hypothetical protein
LNKFRASSGFGALPPKVQSAILTYVGAHPDAIDVVSKQVAKLTKSDFSRIGEIDDAMGCRTPEAFKQWLGEQKQNLRAFYDVIYQPLLDPLGLSPEARREKIDHWLSLNGNATPGRILEAFYGESELKKLSPGEQRYLVHQGLASYTIGVSGKLAKLARDDERFRPVVAQELLNRSIQLQDRPDKLSREIPYERAHQLLEMMRGHEEELGKLISGLTPDDAILFIHTLEDGGNNISAPERHQVLEAINSVALNETSAAATCALYEITSPGDFASTPQLIWSLSKAIARSWYPNDSARAAWENARLKGLMENHLGRNLLFGGTPDRNLTVLATIRNIPGVSAHAIAGTSGEWIKSGLVTCALAQMLMPNDYPNRDSEMDRIAKLLATDQGQKLHFGEVGDEIPPAARSEAQLALLSDPSITAQTLTEKDPWTNPALVTDIARQRAALQGIRNDQPTRFSGYNNLSNFVGVAMGMPLEDVEPGAIDGVPSLFSQEHLHVLVDSIGGAGSAAGGLLSSKSSTARQHVTLDTVRGVIDGSRSAFPQKNVRDVVAQIQAVGGENPRVTYLPVTFSSDAMGPIQYPLFRVETNVQKVRNGSSISTEEIYVDHLRHRIYHSIKEWSDDPKWPPGLLVFPKDGHLRTDKNGAIIFDHAPTYQAVHATERVAHAVVDKTVLVGGVIAGGMVILGTGGTGALLLGAACSAWGFHEAKVELEYRKQHGLSNSWSDPEARALKLSLVANAFGLAALGAGSILRPLAAQAGAVGRVASLLGGVSNWGAAVTNAASLANDFSDFIQNVDTMAPGDIGRLVLKMAFETVVTGVGARHAGSVGELINPLGAARAFWETSQPTVITTEKPGIGVRIENVGGRRVVFASKQAPQSLIDLHVQIARMMELDRGIVGMIKRMLFGGAKPGTLAYSVQYEILKLGKLTERLNTRLSEELTAADRGRIEFAIKLIQQYKKNVIRNLAENPGAGEVPVASPDTSLAAHLDGLATKASEAIKTLKAATGNTPAASAAQVAAVAAIEEYYNALTKSGPEADADRLNLWIMIDEYIKVPGHDSHLVKQITDSLIHIVTKPDIGTRFAPATPSTAIPNQTPTTPPVVPLPVSPSQSTGLAAPTPSPTPPTAKAIPSVVPQNFYPNPAAPNGPKLIKHDQVSKMVGTAVERALKALGAALGSNPSYQGEKTYAALYKNAPAELLKWLPAPGTFRVDDNTKVLSVFVGGLENLIADIHAHPYSYDHRLPWNDRVLGLKPGVDAIIGLLKAAGKNATLAIEAIAQLCGSPGGYYADILAVALSMLDAINLDERVAGVWLALFNSGVLGQSLAAKGYVSMTGLDFSNAGTQDVIGHATNIWITFLGLHGLIGEVAADKELVGQGLGRFKYDLSDPKYIQFLRFLVAEGIEVGIVQHNDVGHIGLDGDGGPMAVKSAYENLPKTIRVYGEPEFRALYPILAHTGLGRYLRPDNKLFEVTFLDKITGQRVTRHVPMQIAVLYQMIEKIPNIRFDISWNDVTQAYVDNQALRDAFVDFIMNNPDRVLFGSDTVKPVNIGQYNQALATAAPLLAEIGRRPGGKEVLWKVLRANAQEILDRGVASVARWLHNKVKDPEKLAQMDERNRILGEIRSKMSADARAGYDKWFDKFLATPIPALLDNPGFFPAFFESHPGVHDHGTNQDGHHDHDVIQTPPAREGANPAFGPVGRGTTGGYANEPKGMNPKADKAISLNNKAAAAISGGVLAVGAAALGHVTGTADAAAFVARGVIGALKTFYGEKQRLDWEEIFEEGHVTAENLNAFVNRIFASAPALGITEAKLVQIAGATEQFLANYSHLAAQPLASYNTINGTEEEQKQQRFIAIMGKIGEYQISLDRILGKQGSSINPFDPRTTLGKVIRGVTLASLLVNDVASVEWIAGGGFDFSSPDKAIESSYKILFALGNSGKLAEAIVGLSGGISGRLNETNPLFTQILQKYSNGVLTAAGAVWTLSDLLGAYDALSQGMLGQAGLHSVKALLESAYTYGMFRVTDFQEAKADGRPTPHPRNLQWALIVLGGALVLTQIIRLLGIGDDEKKEQAGQAGSATKDTPPAPPAASPAAAPKPAPHIVY